MANPQNIPASTQPNRLFRSIAHQPQIRLMYQRRRLQRLARPFVRQFGSRQFAQLVVHERQQPIQRLLIAAPPAVQQRGHVGPLPFAHRPTPRSRSAIADDLARASPANVTPPTHRGPCTYAAAAASSPGGRHTIYRLPRPGTGGAGVRPNLAMDHRSVQRTNP